MGLREGDEKAQRREREVWRRQGCRALHSRWTGGYPKHVHKVLRRYLGIANTPGAQRFPFNNTENFAFFG